MSLLLLRFPVENIRPIVDQYQPFSKHIYFAFSGNNYLNSNLEDGRIFPDPKFELKLEGDLYVLTIDTTKLAKGWHKGKPVIPIQEAGADGRVTVAWIDCPINPFKPFRQEQKRKNWEFLIE